MRQEFIHFLTGCAKTDDVVDAFSASPQAAFLVSAMQVWRKWAALFDIQGADTFRTIQLDLEKARGWIETMKGRSGLD